MNKSFVSFFKENLDGKYAYISSGGLLLQGNAEQKCKLVLSEYYGLECYLQLNHNKVYLKELIRVKLLSLREDSTKADFGYDVFGDIHTGLCELVEETSIKIASIYPAKITKINSDYDKGVLINCELVFPDGCITIRCITDR
jgi:hypothetical protein